MQLKIIRQYQLIIDFIERHPNCSIHQIEERFEQKGFDFSERTFERRKEELRRLGYDIDYENQGYVIRKNESTAQQEVLRRLLKSSSELDFFDEALHTGAGKDHILFDAEQTPKFNDQLPELLKAIINKKAICFSYVFFDGRKVDRKLDLHPLFLKEYLNRWYVIGYSKYVKDIRSYGLDRITELEFTDATFNYTNYQKVRELYEDTVGLTYSGKKIKLILRVEDQQSNYLDSLPLHPSQTYINMKDGWHRYQFDVIWNFELEQRILMLGERASVEEPVQLQDHMRNRIKDMLTLYN